nr:hypothetical protein [Tanacetum cinerariifolium]
MFDKSFRRVNTFKDFRLELVEGKEKRAGEKLEQEITKKQKVDDEKEKAELKQLMETIPDKEEVAIDAISLAVKSPRIIYMLVEKKYPLTPPTLSMMLEKKLQINKDLGKLKAKADISLGPAPNLLTLGPISLWLVPNSAHATPYASLTDKELEILFQLMFGEYFQPPCVERLVQPTSVAHVLVFLAGTPLSITIDQDAPSSIHSPSSSIQNSPSIHKGVVVDDTFEIYKVKLDEYGDVLKNKARKISSPNHPTSNIEDSFSSNFPDYITASPGNISPDPPDNLSKYLFASLAISPFHNMQAYNDVTNKPPIPPQDPITPPTILTPSLVLLPSPLFDPKHFFVPEELLPKK